MQGTFVKGVIRIHGIGRLSRSSLVFPTKHPYEPLSLARVTDRLSLGLA